MAEHTPSPWNVDLVGVDDRDRFAVRVRWIATRGNDRVHVVALTSPTGRVLDVQATSDVLRYGSGTGSRDLDALIRRRTRAVLRYAHATAAIGQWTPRFRTRRPA